MSAKSFSVLAAVVFLLVALGQTLRLVLGWVITVNGHNLPFWPSWLALGIAVCLAAAGLQVARRE